MTDNEKELRRIVDAYLELSAYNLEKALEEYKKVLEQQLEIYKQNSNDNSNQT